MAQQQLGGGAGNLTPDSDSASNPDKTGAHDWIDYLAVNSIQLISALAATLDTVAEVERYIEAETERWNRGAVLRILSARKRALESDSTTVEAGEDIETVFEYTGRRAGSQMQHNGDSAYVIS